MRSGDRGAFACDPGEFTADELDHTGWSRSAARNRSFWTVESLEVANTLTYGGVEAGQYPLDIYTRWFRDFLTFVVALGCVSYFPVAAVLGHANRTGTPDWLLPLTPVVGFLFLASSLWVWRFGVRRYTSTGS